MKNLSKHIENSINEEISLINKKINGIVLLEILKYKIIDRLKNYISDSQIDKSEDSEIIYTYEDEYHKVNSKIKFFRSPVTNINLIIKDNILLICINESINISLRDKNKKNFDFKCIPLTGAVLSKDSKCSINYNKNSIILELAIEDKILNIEKDK